MLESHNKSQSLVYTESFDFFYSLIVLFTLEVIFNDLQVCLFVW